MIKKKIAVNIFLFMVVFLFLMTIKNIDSRHVILEKNYEVRNKSTPAYITYLNDYNFFALKNQIVIKKINRLRYRSIYIFWKIFYIFIHLKILFIIFYKI